MSQTMETTEQIQIQKYLSFFIQDEEYGIEILKVREIIGVTDMTALPKTPPYVKGVINLRGRIIPVIDLKRKFDMGDTEIKEESCIIVTEIQVLEDGDPLQMGCLIDRVSEVTNIEDSKIEPAPKFGGGLDTSFILGLGKTKDRVCILLDIDRVFQESELTEIHSAAENHGEA
ncbi:MAG TPA: purine-binding chemotaxis protein CheW [Planctomycetes bacterium]|nr:purine-binding chemotaxis protein CheW [Planctomycetota bacterium]